MSDVCQCLVTFNKFSAMGVYRIVAVCRLLLPTKWYYLLTSVFKKNILTSHAALIM